MLAAAKSAAIHLSLVMGLPEPQAAKLAGASEQDTKDAILCASQNLRGKVVNFEKWINDNGHFQGDSTIYSYEVHLARLEFQHNECITSWLRTKEHADKMHEHFAGCFVDPLDEKPAVKKPYVGDIRFLQLARHIRREMEKVQKVIDERVEELSKKEGNSVHPSPIPSPAPAPKPALETSATVSTLPMRVSPPTNHLIAAAQEFLNKSPESPSSGALSPAATPQKPWRPKEIPTIYSPPPKRKDKYAGVNR